MALFYLTVSSKENQPFCRFSSKLRSFFTSKPSQVFCSAFLLLHSTQASLDLSNLDLSSFKLFKYPQHTRAGDVIYAHRPFNIIDPFDNFNRFKAMMTYFGDVLFGGAKYKREIAVYFDPDAGAKSRFNFQQKFGHRGERLIAALGNGFNKLGSSQPEKKWKRIK